MPQDCPVDPRQSSADRRYFKAIGWTLLVGIGFFLIPLALWRGGMDIWEFGHGRRGLPLITVVPVGAAIIVYCLGDLVRRWIKGPDKPGKRARY